MPSLVSAPLPDLSYTDKYTITVTVDDPAAAITSLVVHYVQTAPEMPVTVPQVQPLLPTALTGTGG